MLLQLTLQQLLVNSASISITLRRQKLIRPPLYSLLITQNWYISPTKDTWKTGLERVLDLTGPV